MYVYIRSEPELWTTGHYDPDGKWQPESDHGSTEDAAARARYLNGGPSPAGSAEEWRGHTATLVYAAIGRWCAGEPIPEQVAAAAKEIHAMRAWIAEQLGIASVNVDGDTDYPDWRNLTC